MWNRFTRFVQEKTDAAGRAIRNGYEGAREFVLRHMPGHREEPEQPQSQVYLRYRISPEEAEEFGLRPTAPAPTMESLARDELRALDVDGDGKLTRGELYYQTDVRIDAAVLLQQHALRRGTVLVDRMPVIGEGGRRGPDAVYGIQPATHFRLNDTLLMNGERLQEIAQVRWPSLDIAKLFRETFPNGVESLRLSELCHLEPALRCRRADPGQVEVDRRQGPSTSV